MDRHVGGARKMSTDSGQYLDRLIADDSSIFCHWKTSLRRLAK